MSLTPNQRFLPDVGEVAESIEAYRRWCLVSLSENTAKAYNGDLTQFLVYYEQWGADLGDLDMAARSWVRSLDVAPSTEQRKVSAVRGWAGFAQIELLKGYKLPTRAKPEPSPLPNLREDVSLLLRDCTARGDLVGRLIVALQATMGLRISEVRSLRFSDIDFADLMLEVRGKGRRHRRIPISAEALMPLGLALQTPPGGPLYRDVPLPITDSVARKRVVHVCERNGLYGWSSHDLRATFATALIRDGVDVITVQELMGHSSVETIQHYVGASTDDMRTAIRP